MSWPTTTFFCTQCDFKQGDARTWGTKEYVLDNGVRVPLDWRLGWCHDCKGLAAVEALSAEECRKALSEAQKTLSDMGPPPVRRWWQLHRFVFRGLWRKRVNDWMYSACQVEDARDALRLTEKRKNPPRCLACGGSRVIAPLVTDRSEWADSSKPKRTGFVHPGCGGEILMVMDGFRIGLRPSVRRYTPEGNFIGQEFVEGYSFPRGSYYDRCAWENIRIRGMAEPRAE